MLPSLITAFNRLLLRPCTALVLTTALCVFGCSKDDTLETSLQGGPVANQAIASRDLLIRQSQSDVKANRPDDAAKKLRKLLVNDPSDAEVLFRLANVEAQLGRLHEAVGLLESIAPDHPQAGIAALGQTADWYMQLGKYEEAEKKYLELVKRLPDEALPRRQLAMVLNRQGRRHEAAVHVQKLCRLGDVKQEELHSLLSLSDAVYFPTNSPDDDQANESPLGPMGLARFLFTERKYAEAAELLRPLITASVGIHPTWSALYGRSLAESQNDVDFLTWLARADDQTKDCAEYWAGLGTYLLDQRRTQEAIRALGEALRRDATDIRSARRLYQALLAQGQTEIAENWLKRFQDIKETTVLSKRVSDSKGQDTAAFIDLAKVLEQAGRPIEAVMWNWLGSYYANADQTVFSELKARQRLLATDENAFGSEENHLCGLNLRSYALPNLPSTGIIPSLRNDSQNSQDEVHQAAFENIASQIGLHHTYYTATQPKDRGFAIYESLGGGCAVIDYDLDGHCDLYWAQGSADPPGFQATRSDILYRQTDRRVWDVTGPASLNESLYTLGVTSGDWNQDGFPDLVVANIGKNYLWINNGDGTFTAQSLDAEDDRTLLSTSLALADLDGDALPDLFEVNYIHDATIAKLPKTAPDGQTEIVAPLDFIPAIDRIQINDGKGGRVAKPISPAPDERATGLGVVVCNFDDQTGNEVFVGNDVRRDQLWKHAGQGNFENLAPVLGCALGNEGTFTASMGIASGDFDGSHTLDLFITNFEREASSLFLNRGGIFQERSVLYRLAGPRFPWLDSAHRQSIMTMTETLTSSLPTAMSRIQAARASHFNNRHNCS